MTISLCIITKNNESTIKNCLESIKNLVDEIILVDTGSTDNTKEIAKEFNAKIYDFNWNDNFSEAKNFALEKATKDWILCLDADETISQKDFPKIIDLTNKNEFIGFVFIQRNYTNEIGSFEWISSKNDPYPESRISSGYSPRKMIRLFKNHPQIRFEGPVHDSVEKSILKLGKYLETDIPIHHYGMLNRNSERLKFYIELEKKNYQGGFFQDYHLGSQLNTLNELEEAEKYLRKSISANLSFFPSYLELGIVMIKKNNLEEAKKILHKAEDLQIIQKSQKSASLCSYLGTVYGKLNEFEKSIAYFQQAISLLPENADFHFNLGLTYHNLNMKKQAFFEFKKAVELNPEYKKIISLE